MKGTSLRSVFEAERREAMWELLDSRALAGRRVEFLREQWVRASLLYSDLVLAMVVWWVAAMIRNLLVGGTLSEVTIAVILPGMLGWLALRYAMGLYPGYALSQVDELRKQSYATLAAASVSIVFAFFLQVGEDVSRLVMFLGFAGILLLGPLARHGMKCVLRRFELWGKPVVIIGPGGEGWGVVRALREEWGLGLRPAALFEHSDKSSANGEFAEAVEISRKHGVDTIMLVMPGDNREEFGRISNLASYSFRRVIVIPDLVGVISSAVAVRDISGNFGVEIKHNLLDPWARRAKRTLDLLLTTVGGVVMVPLLLVLAVLVKLDSSGPAFYAQQRLGAEGKRFRCWKFRTMKPNAELMLEEYLRNRPDLRAQWEVDHKLHDDPRVTRVGRFLRKTSLDELPQLWNVLRGQMSLVGPRPIVEAEVEKYAEAYDLYRRVTPGISGIWQVSGRSDTTYEERVSLDSYYVRSWSVWLDLVILARTFESVLLKRGAY